MTEIPSDLSKVYKWLKSDQYPHGEWGRCEANNPTDDVRNFEISRIKPNLFISSQAILALLATGFNEQDVYKKFFAWINKLRREDGYWVSASGSLIPSGKGRGWSEVKNIRHTAKALDLLLMRGEFVPADAAILHELLSLQFEHGAFPQHPGGNADIWSTAYVMNFIIRNLYSHNISKSQPRGTTIEEWAVKLRSHLDKARAWICSQISADGLWHLAERDPLWITEAVLSEVGADLSLNRPDLCIQIANRILDQIDKTRILSIWAMLLILHTLRPEQQRRILDLLHDLKQEDLPKDTFDVSSYCKLLWLRDHPYILYYYISDSLGHESTLKLWSQWDQSEYIKWSIERIMTKIESNQLVFNPMPSNKADAWSTVAYLLNCFKDQIENNRGWELLWNDDNTPKDEKAVQINFWNITKPICRKNDLIIRESDTGVGPIDFEFINGFCERIHIEFKLSSNQKLEHGFKVQLPAYMKAENVDSAYFVVVGFEESHIARYKFIAKEAVEQLKKNPDSYIQCVYIDASRRKSASKR